MRARGTPGPDRRTLLLVLGMVVFLPPLALLLQVGGEVNLCGAWCPRMFFVWRSDSTLATFVAGMARSMAGVGLVVAVLATTLLFGRHWCSHLCPVGGPLELGGRLVPRRLRIDFSTVPAPTFRHAYLAVYLVAPALGLGSLCCSYCNFAAVPRLFGAAFSAADLAYFLRVQGVVNLALLIVLGVLARGGRAYCNLLCPVGAVDALVNRLGDRLGRRVRIDRTRCTDCGSCEASCPTWAISPRNGETTIDQLSCIPCRRCVDACPEGAIGYGRSSG